MAVRFSREQVELMLANACGDEALVVLTEGEYRALEARPLVETVYLEGAAPPLPVLDAGRCPKCGWAERDVVWAPKWAGGVSSLTTTCNRCGCSEPIRALDEPAPTTDAVAEAGCPDAEA